MSKEELKKQILATVYRHIGHTPSRNAYLVEIKAATFDRVGEEFWSAAQELVNEGLLDHRARGYVALTHDGWAAAKQMVSPSPVVNNTNTLNIGNAYNSPIQQGIGSTQTQNVVFETPTPDDLRKLVALLEAHLSELSLDQATDRKARAQINTLKAQLMDDEPNATIVKESGRSLRKVLEGAMGNLVAGGVTSAWPVIQSLLSMF